MPRAIILFLGLSLSLSSLIAVVSGAVAQQLLAGLCPAGPNPFNLRPTLSPFAPGQPGRFMRFPAGGPMANGFSGTSDIDALAASMLMSLARHVDFAAAYLAAPDDHVSDAGHVT